MPEDPGTDISDDL